MRLNWTAGVAAIAFGMLPGSGGAGEHRRAAAHSAVDPRAEANRALTRAMGDFDRLVLTEARTSGRKFPAYVRWLAEIGSAVGRGMDPASVQPGRDPLRPPSRDVRALAAAASDAEAELADLLPPMPQSRDLQAIAAFKERTRPTKLNRVLLTVFQAEGQTVRAAAAGLMRTTYALPS